MLSSKLRNLRLAAAVAACSALFVVGVPSAIAVPNSDRQGYVDSTARCAAPDTAVFFGSTETSRVAICKTADGQYQYRGVRLRDGAKLIVPASASDDSKFVADNDGITYAVTASSLVVSAGRQMIREEAMVDFHSPDAPRAATGTSVPAAPPTTTSPTPWMPPLAAEVGGSGRR